jgi:hypothetical protein
MKIQQQQVLNLPVPVSEGCIICDAINALLDTMARHA